MSFFDEYSDLSSTGGTWLTGEEKLTLMQEGIPITITSVKLDERNKFGPRYIVFCLVPNPETGQEEERKIGFPTESGVESRNQMLEAMASYLEREDAEPVHARLEKVDRAILIRQA